MRRRLFLVALSVGLAGLPWGPASGRSASPATGAASQPASAPAGGEAFAPFVFIHAGDTELGSPDLAGTAGRLNALVARANALKADAFILAGDIWHDPDRPEQQRAMDEALGKLRMPFAAVPGNHDQAHMDVYRKRFGPANTVFTCRNCDFVLLDSNHPTPEALRWLEAALADGRRRNRTHTFVVMHHPPAEGDSVDRILQRGRVSAVFSGHLHKTGSADRGGYKLYWVSGSAKARDERGLRFNLVRVGAGQVEVDSRLIQE